MMQKNINFTRSNNRAFDQLRPLKVSYGIYPYAAGSTLFEIGNTKILCSITIQNGVPHFLRGKKCGWLTAEYSLLPSATPVRTVREITANKRSGRVIEISRLIGRALRSVTDLSVLGEQTIFVDCDVLQADGGTRVASITGAFLALRAAQEKWRLQGLLDGKALIKDELAAISVGLSNHGPLLDMDFAEDSMIDADYSFVLTRLGKIIEIQGCAERAPISWDQYDQMKMLANQGAQELFFFYDNQGMSPEVPDHDMKSNYIFPSFSQHMAFDDRS